MAKISSLKELHAKRKTFVLWDLGHRARVEEAPHVNHQQVGYDRGRQKEKGLPASSPAVQHLIKSRMLQGFSFIPNNIANYAFRINN